MNVPTSIKVAMLLYSFKVLCSLSTDSYLLKVFYKMNIRQADCFNFQIKLWKFLAIWPTNRYPNYFKNYSLLFVTFFIILYDVLYTINFYFLPRQLDFFVGEMILYFTELALLSKLLTFLFLRDKIKVILNTLDSKIFRPDSEESVKVVIETKKFIIRCFRIVAAISIAANVGHIIIPFLMHLFLSVPLVLPVCSYLFLSDVNKERLIYPLFFYQGVGMHFQMLYNVSIDTFFWGLLILTIAQLRILDFKLRNITCYRGSVVTESINQLDIEASIELALNKCIKQYDALSKFCSLIQDVFSTTLFIQFGMASCIICVCLFRFTLPASIDYYVFLGPYMIMMIFQIMVPCWFGTRLNDTSTLLSTAIYNCDWTPRTRCFKSSLRLFVERANKPLTITGGKMFPLSLETFSSIMSSAYSFFTLLRHMQSRES